MIQQIEFAQDYEVPYIRETLLNYLLSTGPSGDGTGGRGLQLTLWGILGISIGILEGLRFQWFALEFGLNPWKGEIYWPGIGTLRLWS